MIFNVSVAQVHFVLLLINFIELFPYLIKYCIIIFIIRVKI